MTAIRVKVQAPAGSHNVLQTLAGWDREGDGWYTVTDPDWKETVADLFGATVIDTDDIQD